MFFGRHLGVIALVSPISNFWDYSVGRYYSPKFWQLSICPWKEFIIYLSKEQIANIREERKMHFGIVFAMHPLVPPHTT